ncbi:MAG: hypothetical protein R3332_09035 [Pseudohongiellaceae bacterium]|nr:hypothetical protein [Pseudohongiellaceae bacterium]
MKFFHKVCRQLSFALTLTLALLSSATANASTLMQLSIEQVLHRAELVFEGEVLATDTVERADGSIRTYVRFAVTDLIKGAYSNDTIDLSYLGGRLGDRQLRVSDMQIPAVGEVGIYFVESVSQSMVSPLVGWAQGHYLIERIGGDTIISTADGQAVVAVNAGSASASSSFSTGVAKGIVVPKSAFAKQLTKPLTPRQFKQALRAIMDEQ